MVSAFQNRLIAIAVMLVIPVGTFVMNSITSFVMSMRWEDELDRVSGGLTAYEREQLSLSNVCADPSRAALISDLCRDYDWLWLFNMGAVGIGIVSAGTVIGISVAGWLGANNRDMLLSLFRPGIYLILAVAAGLVLANAALIIGTLYFAMVEFLGIIWPWIFVVLGLGAILAGIALLGALSGIAAPATVSVHGVSVARSRAPSLWALVDNIAHRMGANPPRSIVVGLSPTFFVVDAQVNAIDETVTGETLYISLPLCRVLTVNEFSSVVAHELAHFRGEDTRYSREFLPVYRGVQESIDGLLSTTENPLQKVSILPALLLLNLYLEAFATAERSIGRQREFEADRTAVMATNPQSLATALVKVSQFAPLWERVLIEIFDPAQTPTSNASAFFAWICRNTGIQESSVGSAEKTMPHPMDSHPPMPERLAAINMHPSVVADKIEGEESATSAITTIEHHEQIEKSLTLSMIDLFNYAAFLRNQQAEQATSK